MASISDSPPGSYSLDLFGAVSLPDWDAVPTELPPHLERALLNCAPVVDDPDQLPLPHRVMVNHMYSRPPHRLRDAIIFGLTSRHEGKFVTTVFYQKNNSL